MVQLGVDAVGLVKAALGATAGGAAAVAILSGDHEDPQGAANRPGTNILNGISRIDDAQVMRAENVGSEYVIEFHMPDQDSKFASVVSISKSNGRITEATIRLGPLGHQSEISDSEWRDLEGRWFDVVMDAAPGSVMEHLDGTTVDLGDKWVSDKARPHVRLHEKRDGYDISAHDFVDFLDALSSRFEGEFGEFAMRMGGGNFREGW